jgi:hypothetical protein
MQLSQFDKQATLAEDGKVTVFGAVAQETDEHGNVVPRRNPVRFHFLIFKDGRVLHGESASIADRWSGTTSDADQGMSMGPAVAFGLAVEVKEKPTPMFLTSSWVEEITLQPLV